MNKEQIFKHIDEKTLRLPYYVEKYVDYKRADDRAKPNTILSYLYDYERFFDWIISEGYHPGPAKDVPLSVLEEFRREDITNFQNYLMRYTNMEKRTSRNRMMSSLKSLFNHLSQIEEDLNGDPLLRRNIMAKIEINNKKPSPQEQANLLKGRVFKSVEEILDFLHFVEHRYISTIKDSNEKEGVKKRLIHYYNLNKERDMAFLSLILGSGLRVNETVMLDLNDIDWKERGAKVERKGKEGKSLVLFTKRARFNLQQYLKIREERYRISSKEKAVFLSLPTGPTDESKKKNGKSGVSGRFTKRAAQEMVIKYSKWYGKPMTVHNLRHSFATAHWKENQDVFALQSQLGHTDPKTTQRYALIFDSTLRDEIDKMDADFFPDITDDYEGEKN